MIGLGLGTGEFTSWRPTKQISSGGGAVNTYSATPTLENKPVLLEKLTPGRRVELYGIDSKATYSAWVDVGMDLQVLDIVKVTAGPHAGRYLLVEDLFPMTNDEFMVMLGDSKERPDQ